MLPRFGSIRTQLQLLAALSAATALAVACGAFVLNDVRFLKQAKRQTLYRYAAVVARNSGPALAERDWERAGEQLTSLRLEPTVTAACLYDPAGNVRGVYRRDDLDDSTFPAPDNEAWLRDWNQDELALFQPIYRDGARVGSLFMRSTRDDIHQQEAFYPLIVGVVFLISLGVSAAFASRMQARIASPIEALSRTAERITADGDYTTRVVHAASGQLGELCNAFNAMLARIEASDRGLQEARDKLNARVRDRTRELHREVLERRFAESIASGQSRVMKQLATGQPLSDVLASLITEIESHIRHTQAAISLIEPGVEWLEEPVAMRLSSAQRDGLRLLPISPAGNAPARAAATLEPQCDRRNGERPADEAGFD